MSEGMLSALGLQGLANPYQVGPVHAQQAPPHWDEVVTRDYLVGRLLCGAFRDGLKRFKFRGNACEWIESSGWTQRVFTVRASYRVHGALYGWVKQLEDSQ